MTIGTVAAGNPGPPYLFLRSTHDKAPLPDWNRGSDLGWSPTNGSRTTSSFVSWPHGALSPEGAQEAAAAERRRRRRQGSGAAGAVRAAALELAGSSGAAPMARQELLDHVAATYPGYSREAVREALEEHVRDADGVLARLHVGLYRLRRAEDVDRGGTLSVRDWVLKALASLRSRADRPVTRRDVEEELAGMGLRYSTRSVSKGLTDLVRDPGSAVTRTADQRYQLGRMPFGS